MNEIAIQKSIRASRKKYKERREVQKKVSQAQKEKCAAGRAFVHENRGKIQFGAFTAAGASFRYLVTGAVLEQEDSFTITFSVCDQAVDEYSFKTAKGLIGNRLMTSKYCISFWKEELVPITSENISEVLKILFLNLAITKSPIVPRTITKAIQDEIEI